MDNHHCSSPQKDSFEGQKYDVWGMVIQCRPTITRDSLSSVSNLFMGNDQPLWWKVKGQTCTPSPESADPWRKQIAFGQYIDVWPRKAAGFGTCILKGTILEHYGTWPWEISPLISGTSSRNCGARGLSISLHVHVWVPESSLNLRFTYIIVAKFGTPLMTLVTCSQMFTDHFCYLKLAKKRTAYQA